jgi:DNA repair exonuclease SbcCD ATPase subunit
MKKSELKQLIKEEIDKILNESENITTPEEKLIALANSSRTFNEFLKKAEQHLKKSEVNPSRAPLTANSYVGKALKSIWNRRNN